MKKESRSYLDIWEFGQPEVDGYFRTLLRICCVWGFGLDLFFLIAGNMTGAVDWSTWTPATLFRVLSVGPCLVLLLLGPFLLLFYLAENIEWSTKNVDRFGLTFRENSVPGSVVLLVMCLPAVAVVFIAWVLDIV